MDWFVPYSEYQCENSEMSVIFELFEPQWAWIFQSLSLNADTPCSVKEIEYKLHRLRKRFLSNELVGLLSELNTAKDCDHIIAHKILHKSYAMFYGDWSDPGF